MKKIPYTSLSDAELLEEKKKWKRSRILHATLIGFMAGILIFGVVSWSLSPEKRIGFFIPMLIPVVFIYRMLKNRKSNSDLEEVLKKRGFM
jgi:hypothetical protein